jgi:type III restriction enzyme
VPRRTITVKAVRPDRDALEIRFPRVEGYCVARPVKVLLDANNPTGSTAHVRFNTSKTLRWKTRADRCHVNWAILDSGWEAELCRLAESHPRVKAYVRNHNLGFEVPYRYGSETRAYRPDYIILVDDGHGNDDLLHLVVEIKGYGREDATEKKATMETCWVPGVNNLGTHGRWAFAELRTVRGMRLDFEEAIERNFDAMVDAAVARSPPPEGR